MTFRRFLKAHCNHPNPLGDFILNDPCLPRGRGINVDDLTEHFANVHRVSTGFLDALEDAWEAWHRQRYYERIAQSRSSRSSLQASFQ